VKILHLIFGTDFAGCVLYETFTVTGIGTMVYSGLELGHYFELKSVNGCHNVSTKNHSNSERNNIFVFNQIFMLLNPLGRLILAVAQMQFICECFFF
jgi:hypothetical protein